MNIIKENNFKKLLSDLGDRGEEERREERRKKLNSRRDGGHAVTPVNKIVQSKSNFKWKKLSDTITEEDDDCGNENCEDKKNESLEGEGDSDDNESDDEADDDDALDPGSVGLGSALIIGKSNTGKSTLVKRLVEKYNSPPDRPVFLLNDQTGRKAPSGIQKISWDQILNIKKCCLIVEDLVKCSTRQVNALSNLINVQNHHAQVRPIFFITHTLRGNGFYGLLKCYNALCLAAENSHRDDLKEIIVRFAFSDELAANCVTLFRQGCAQGKFTFIWIDLDTKKAILIKAEKK